MTMSEKPLPMTMRHDEWLNSAGGGVGPTFFSES